MYPEYLKQYIPPEFDIAKYNKTADMPIELWIINILIKLLGYKAYELQIDLSSVSQSDLETLIPAFELVLAKGLITELDDNFYLMFNDLIGMDKAKYTDQVRELTYYDLFTMIEDLKSGEMEKLYLEIGKSINPPIAILLQKKLGKLNQTLDINDKYWENYSSSLLKVDLDCSDNEIKIAFSDWLKEKRKQQNRQNTKNLPRRENLQMKNLNQTTFRKWHDARVLAYMDLVAWNYLQGNKLTSKIIGDILFPDLNDPRDSKDMVNDKVKPLAIKLVQLNTIKRMIKVFADKNRKKIT